MIWPVCEPFAAGVNVTTSVHFPPAVSVVAALQVVADVSAKSPLIATAVIVVVVRPVLVTVTVLCATGRTGLHRAEAQARWARRRYWIDPHGGHRYRLRGVRCAVYDG